jgi:serine/threonine protein kinase
MATQQKPRAYFRRCFVVPEAGWQPIPGYQLTQRLGAGAFGDVWEARCGSPRVERRERSELTLDDRSQRVALKFIDCRKHSTTLVASEVRVLRGLTELHHPHIIGLLGVHATGKYLILVMERADGNLADLREAYQEETRGNIPTDHALDLLEQAAVALDFLAGLDLPGISRARGLQHCDIKPSNLLLVGENLKVADFGLCAASGWHTHSGGWKGTLPYAAPELFNGAAATGTDQFALAVTFCEMVMGDRPFFPSALPKGLPSIPRPGELPIDLTKLRDKEFPVIARALHPYPSSRYPSCQEFIRALRKATGSARGTRRPLPRTFTRSPRRSGEHRRPSFAGR